MATNPRLMRPRERVYRKGHCCWCGKSPLPPRRQSWCSDRCVREYLSFEPAALRKACWERDRGFCRSCHRDLGETAEPWEADHRIPICEGGLNVLANIRILCLPCHRRETRVLMGRRAEARRARVTALDGGRR